MSSEKKHLTKPTLRDTRQCLKVDLSGMICPTSRTWLRSFSICCSWWVTKTSKMPEMVSDKREEGKEVKASRTISNTTISSNQLLITLKTTVHLPCQVCQLQAQIQHRWQLLKSINFRLKRFYHPWPRETHTWRIRSAISSMTTSWCCLVQTKHQRSQVCWLSFRSNKSSSSWCLLKLSNSKFKKQTNFSKLLKIRNPNNKKKLHKLLRPKNEKFDLKKTNFIFNEILKIYQN